MELFKGLKVVDCSSVLAGPQVGTFFSELGAHVLKFENAKTNGDVTRTWHTPAESKEKSVLIILPLITKKKFIMLIYRMN